MTSEIAHVANFDREVLTRLPLNVERLVESIREFVGTVVIGEGEQRYISFDLARIRQKQILGIAAGRWIERGPPGVFESA